jgi:hypothetical protein
MTDLRTLTDAFAELERRGDAAAARMPDGLPRRARTTSRLVPAAVAAAVVAGLATGVALFAPDDEVGGGTMAASASTPPTPPAPAATVPATPAELAGRFTDVLGDLATFTVTETGTPVRITLPPAPGDGRSQEPVADPTPSGVAIVGTLTSAGVTGGYDLQIYRGSESERESWCDSPEEGCARSRLPDGSSLAVGTTTTLEGGGVTYLVNLVRPDGVTTLMHLSNQRSPKGASDLLAPRPPLTTGQMVAIVTADGW